MRKQVESFIREHFDCIIKSPWPEYPDHVTFANRYEKWFGIAMKISNRKLGLCEAGETDILNVKADPELVSFLRQAEGFLPAYHMNKNNWITLRLDGSLPFEEICYRIEDSYRMVTDTPTHRIYEAVKRIPSGHVATYGQVAKMAGDRKMARAVGNALHKNPDPEHIPCFRVVNAKGELAGEFAFGGAGEQAKLLWADGIEVIDGKVDLARFGMKEEG